MIDGRLRLGCIEFLNSQPLVDRLPEVLPDAELVRDMPSVLADQLEGGELDAALVPIVEHLKYGAYHLIPRIAIGCDGPVWSIKLLCRCAVESIRTVALDPASRTSVALTRVLCAKRFHITPRYFTWSHADEPERIDADAVLVIGDRAMRCVETGFRVVLDLGLVWKQWTGLPFVFAVWSCRSRRVAHYLTQPLIEAKRRGLRCANQIAELWAPRVGWPPSRCHAYLTTALCYDFGPQQARAVAYFHSLLNTISSDRFGRHSFRRPAA